MKNEQSIEPFLIGVSRCARCGAERGGCVCPKQQPTSSDPVPMDLFCPFCGLRHVDKGEWATRPHKTHQCQFCKKEWRLFDYATVGASSPSDPQPAAMGAREFFENVWRKRFEHVTGGWSVADMLQFAEAYHASQRQPSDADALIQRVDDYRSGYSSGYSDAKNGTRMRDKDAASLFFHIHGIPDIAEPEVSERQPSRVALENLLRYVPKGDATTYLRNGIAFVLTNMSERQPSVSEEQIQKVVGQFFITGGRQYRYNESDRKDLLEFLRRTLNGEQK